MGSRDAGPMLISVADLVFDYPGKRALHGLTFDIAEGSITALVGPNGAGKSTLLRCLAALERPYAGEVRVAGWDMAEDPRAVHRVVGYLQDFYGLYDSLTVRRCLTYHARARAVPEAEVAERVAVVARDLGIAERMDERAGTLSRGLRQRLAIAQSIVHRPRLLLLDEPASGLDPEARHALSRLLVRLRDDGMTLLVSSHILSELQDYSSHVMILREGRLVEHAPLGAVARSAAAARRRIRLRLAAPVPGLTDRLAGLGAEAIAAEADGAGAAFDFAGDDADQGALLRRLMQDGVPVCEFHALHASMQDLYLDRLRSQERRSPVPAAGAAAARETRT